MEGISLQQMQELKVAFRAVANATPDNDKPFFGYQNPDGSEAHYSPLDMAKAVESVGTPQETEFGKMLVSSAVSLAKSMDMSLDAYIAELMEPPKSSPGSQGSPGFGF